MASLQARHSRGCALRRPWTTFRAATKAHGCNCQPLYHVVFSSGGKLVRQPVGHNRKQAERALDAIRGDLARKRYRVLEDVRFDEWADRWLEALRTSGRKASYTRTLASTLSFAKVAFGATKVRELDSGDVSRFLEAIAKEHERKQEGRRRARRKPATTDASAGHASGSARNGETPAEEKPKPVSQATLAKHLRQLGSCLSAAVAEGYAADNPVRRLHASRRPRVEKRAPAYFTDGELARLWPALAERPIYRALCQLALTTGMRSGELIALRWSDVELLTGEARIERTYVAGVGETTPKSGAGRIVDLTPEALNVLNTWWKEAGEDGGLIFEKETGGYIDAGYVLTYVLYPAMDAAGVPRVGEHGRARNFHSLRHTFARIALENGAPLQWVQQQLGHSSITLTADVYGRWAREAQKAQARALAGVFAINS
jgi:integrase